RLALALRAVEETEGVPGEHVGLIVVVVGAERLHPPVVVRLVVVATEEVTREPEPLVPSCRDELRILLVSVQVLPDERSGVPGLLQTYRHRARLGPVLREGLVPAVRWCAADDPVVVGT